MQRAAHRRAQLKPHARMEPLSVDRLERNLEREAFNGEKRAQGLAAIRYIGRCITGLGRARAVVGPLKRA